jgi:hypothetical protein
MSIDLSAKLWRASGFSTKKEAQEFRTKNYEFDEEVDEICLQLAKTEKKVSRDIKQLTEGKYKDSISTFRAEYNDNKQKIEYDKKVNAARMLLHPTSNTSQIVNIPLVRDHEDMSRVSDEDITIQLRQLLSKYVDPLKLDTCMSELHDLLELS